MLKHRSQGRGQDKENGSVEKPSSFCLSCSPPAPSARCPLHDNPRSRAQQGSGLAVDPAGCELAALPSKLFTPTAANSHLSLGLLKPERSQSVQELSHMIMQLKKPGIQDGDKQGKCSLCKTGSRVDKIAACSSRARSKIAASRKLMKELEEIHNCGMKDFPNIQHWVNDPQPEHPLRADLAEEYSEDRKKFCKNAEEVPKKYGERRPVD
ncbi:hypothetical protein GH733_018851 [Mirounga leonina]|nr:hypothetical protein GH733_018851 [Mirounga leonina]